MTNTSDERDAAQAEHRDLERNDLQEDLGLPGGDAGASVPADEEEGRTSAGGPGIGAMGVTANVEDAGTALTDQERNP
ncbi:MAG TPA: hypothetical protein VN200_07030 [Rhodoglobus sp.]|nr:hypothetical protein [Rhodoglobus sp.]